MDQELISLRAQVEEQQESLRPLTANNNRLNDAAFRAARTPSTTEGPSVQSDDAVKQRFRGREFETSEFRFWIETINEELGSRTDGERRHGLHIQELRESLTGAHALLENIVQAQETAKASQAQLGREIEALRDRGTSGHGTPDHKVLLIRQKGFPNLKLYNGEGGSARWKEWRFGIMHWIEQEYPAVAGLIRRVETLETEPLEPKDGSTPVILAHNRGAVSGEEDTLKTEDEWASEQVWALLVDKATNNAYKMIVGPDNATRSRGVRAWFKLSLEASGTHLVRILKVTERLHAPDRKRVQAKDVVPALEAEDALCREYIEITDKEVPEAFRILNLRKIVPDKIRETA